MDIFPETTRYALVMLAAGIGIPVLAALNAQLGTRLGSPAAAATCLFVVAFLSAATVLLLTNPQAITAATSAPKHLFLAGTLVAFYILTITWAAPKFGVGNAVFFVLLGQMISAAAIDHYGLLGARISPLSLTRASGIALMALGVLLTQRV
ncbi:MAG: DMT family transporter [Marinosulfonomonas sp.]|nr:DMT family transporter [Marinosulfonomonas sp.]